MRIEPQSSPFFFAPSPQQLFAEPTMPPVQGGDLFARQQSSEMDPSQMLAMYAVYQQMMGEIMQLLIMWVMQQEKQQQPQGGGQDLGKMNGPSFSGAPQRSTWNGQPGEVNTSVGATPGKGGAEQWRAMAEEYGRAYGVPADYILALIKTESNGNPRAIGDNGHSVGLFQLHDRGVGAGMSVEERMDPKVQFEKMMPRIKAAYESGRAKGLDGSQLAIHIAREAERPAEWTLPKYGQNYDAIVSGRA